MTCVILQARLDSTRLPQKALLDLDGKPILVRVMENLRKIPADEYVLACDTDSEKFFAPLAASCAFKCVSGPKEDVLERFCIVIRTFGVTTVIRATGDNPFIFTDAAEVSVRRYTALQNESNPVDYFTFTGVPHGSGIEVFSGRRLLQASTLADSAYDREHVGPALYRHQDRFVCKFETAPVQWYHPEVRTTIDTRADYENAVLMIERIKSKSLSFRVCTESVLEAWNFVSRPLVFVPSVAVGQGTGHIRRLAGIIERIKDDWRCLCYMPLQTETPSKKPLTKYFPELDLFAITELPPSAHLVIVDGFRTSHSEMERLRSCGPVIALDEGGSGRQGADFLFDIIPGIMDRTQDSNLRDASFIPLPIRRKSGPLGELRTALVVAGGENAAGLAIPIAHQLAREGLKVIVIDPHAVGLVSTDEGVIISGPILNLREKLFEYDLVATHYGFTAFEALAAGCRVILFSPTRYHFLLGKAQGFAVIPLGPLKKNTVKHILSSVSSYPRSIYSETVQKDLAEEILHLAGRTVRACPLCSYKVFFGALVRFADRTVVSCPECNMQYVSFLVAEGQSYTRSYFFDEYLSQYGKTYLEDFESIRNMGIHRLAFIENAVQKSLPHLDVSEKKLLDIGCAYGPFLSAAKDSGWDAWGTDISSDAVQYVRDTLKIPAFISAFPAPDGENNISKHLYAAVTLWFVIEHFEDLEPVFQRIRELLIPGGILAFSTPSAAGISARFNTRNFYQNSPKDHYTLWDPRKVRKQLLRYGFSVLKIVSTGHHPERFPGMKKKNRNSLAWKLCDFISRACALGDTFEVYAFKNGTTGDVT